MCVYCERRTDVKCGWDQFSLCDEHWQQENVIPDKILSNLTLNKNNDWKAVIHDYQTCTPQLIITSKDVGQALFGDGGIATIYIPIKYCPVCGRKLGKINILKDDCKNTEEKYTLEQIVDAIVQADNAIFEAIRYRDREMLQDVLQEYLVEVQNE